MSIPSGHYKWYQSGTSAPMEQLFISTNELVHSIEGLLHSTKILVDSTKRLEAMVERYLVMLGIELPPPILVESPTIVLQEMTETPSSSTLLLCSDPATQHAARDDVHLGIETGLRRMKGISQVPFPSSISLPCGMNFTCAIEFWGRQVKKWKYDCDYEFETCLVSCCCDVDFIGSIHSAIYKDLDCAHKVFEESSLLTSLEINLAASLILVGRSSELVSALPGMSANSEMLVLLRVAALAKEKKATELDLNEFFSFFGEVDCIVMQTDTESSQIAYMRFKEPQGAEIAVQFGFCFGFEGNDFLLSSWDCGLLHYHVCYCYFVASHERKIYICLKEPYKDLVVIVSWVFKVKNRVDRFMLTSESAAKEVLNVYKMAVKWLWDSSECCNCFIGASTFQLLNFGLKGTLGDYLLVMVQQLEDKLALKRKRSYRQNSHGVGGQNGFMNLDDDIPRMLEDRLYIWEFIVEEMNDATPHLDETYWFEESPVSKLQVLEFTSSCITANILYFLPWELYYFRRKRRPPKCWFAFGFKGGGALLRYLRDDLPNYKEPFKDLELAGQMCTRILGSYNVADLRENIVVAVNFTAITIAGLRQNVSFWMHFLNLQSVKELQLWVFGRVYTVHVEDEPHLLSKQLLKCLSSLIQQLDITEMCQLTAGMLIAGSFNLCRLSLLLYTMKQFSALLLSLRTSLIITEVSLETYVGATQAKLRHGELRAGISVVYSITLPPTSIVFASLHLSC